MKLVTFRNLAFASMLAFGLLASKTASAVTGCWQCSQHWFATDYCIENSPGQYGFSNCVDPNQGYQGCSEYGSACTDPSGRDPYNQ